MTHSGQGDETRLPAARPAHEGVVLPADGSGPWIPGVSEEQVAPAGGAPWGAPWGPEQGAQQQQPQQPVPQSQPLPEPGQHAPYAQPLPPYDGGATAQLPGQYGDYGQYGQPAAQPLPPVQAHPAAAGDADATQYIAPVPHAPVPHGGPGALPPENPVESTQFLGMRPAAAAPPAGGDSEATQYLPPVPSGAPYGIRPGAPGDRQPPAEFDNLFRSEAGGAAEGAGASTQYLPPVPPAPSAPYAQSAPPAPQPQQSYAPERRSSRMPLIAAVVVGCAVVGLGASALMFGGDDDDKGRTDDKAVAAANSPAPDASGDGAADPAKAQAEALDKLLADSNDSRAAVIRSVESIKSCKNLDQAASDLRGAAEQRRGLVTRLEGLSVDKLPDHAALTAALNRAWKASASADDYYAEWAVQTKGKKGCPGGTARQTNKTAQANRASGDATTAKREASALWNAIATDYDLPKRGATQL
ncbi:hypothetical protein [Streptomyces formicae]|uniref:Basic proline-rich protein n=1 Tax=Streptomyces formicae TaxID=1616117 RepID=A0ABY3X1A8_9ACTN|nr:hypothetical protein [Streptomyces formicae]UNM15803.1 hypothetical protein J4032_33940 [Streptomyces formicae]